MAEKVLAPMVGKILKIKIKVGDQVEEDSEVNPFFTKGRLLL